MLNLYTENFFLAARVKNLIKTFLGREQRGPQTVALSLRRGLKVLGVDFHFNKPLSQLAGTVGILGNAKTLAWAIRQKQLGKIKKIIAGPNLVVSARSENNILSSPEIDKIIVPSQWVYNNYAHDVPVLGQKLRIWPAGVEIPESSTKPKIFDFLLYNKIGKTKLFFDICGFLESKGLSYQVLRYGHFRQREFFEFLQVSKNLIYLSTTESQGLAMFEAWARNVPVFAWERGFWEIDGSFQAGNTATPYLSAETGRRFRDFEGFKSGLDGFMAADFHPKDYLMQNFTDRICAQKYLDIINEP